MSYPLMVDYPSCDKTCDDSDVEEKFRQEELPAPHLDIRIGSPCPRFRTHFLQKKTDDSEILLRDRHMHDVRSRDVCMHLISKGGQIYPRQEAFAGAKQDGCVG